MLFGAEFWVAIAFLIFLGILGYAGAYRKVIDALDRRGADIRRDLEEARDFKHEAESLLRKCQNRQREVDHEIEAIMDGARAEAQRLMTEAKVSAGDVLRRRTKMAETKIAQAELQAVADVRSAAAEAAASAAEEILIRSVNGGDADRVFSGSLQAVKAEFGLKS